MTAVGALTTLVASVPPGLLADRFGRARIFILSAVLVPFPYLMMVFSSSLGVIIVSYMLANLLATVYWSTNAPLLVGAVSAADRVRVFAVNSFFLWGVGALGSVIGGVIPSVVGHLIGQSSDALTPLRVAIGANAVICAIGVIPLL